MKIKWMWLLVCLLAGTALHSPRAEAVKYSYDEGGRLIGVFYESGQALTFLYDGAGNLIRKSSSTFIDADGDSLDDGWEVLHFGNLVRDGKGDFDGNGMSDLAEYLAGTDPRNPASALRVIDLSRPSRSRFSIEWAAIPGKVYRVQFNETLWPQDWRDLPGDIAASDVVATKTDEVAAGAGRRFYRVVVLP